MRFLRRIRRLIVDSLGFSKTEANGFMILFLIVLLIGVVPRVYFNSRENNNEKFGNDKELHAWAADIEASIKKREREKVLEKARNFVRKPFDPNTSSHEELVAGGLPKYLATRLIKYRDKGGVYREVADLKKMYGMTDSLYAFVEPFVRLSVPKEKDRPKFEKYVREEIVIEAFELNRATVEELQQIRGIGPSISERIVKYRNLLGGYSSELQLREVYGLKEEVIDKLLEHAHLDETVNQITVNTDSVKLLSTHPYISYNLARAIVNYRQVHGDYEELTQLMSIKVMNDSLYQKLSPYLSL